MIVLETVSRQSIVKSLVDAMINTDSIDSTELSDFVDALYGTKFERWTLCEVSVGRLYEVCRAGRVFDKWQECDNVKSSRFALMSTEPPALVLYLNSDLLVLLDGRHRLVAAREIRKTIRVAIPSIQLTRLKVRISP